MNDDTALVTGGNKGIGFAVARKLAEEGYRVILTARNGKNAEEAARALPEGKAEAFELDVTRTDQLPALKSLIEKKYHGRLGVLVNNAGIMIDGREAGALDTPIESYRKTLETNLFGALRLTQCVIPCIIQNGGGTILNISSGLGQLSTMSDGYPAYRISKAALNALSRILSEELKDQHIRVYAVSPGWVRTDMGGPNAPRSPETAAEGIVRLLRVGVPTGSFVEDAELIPW